MTQNCTSQGVLEPNFSMVCIRKYLGNELESDPQISLHEDLKEKFKEGQTSTKTSADRKMIA